MTAPVFARTETFDIDGKLYTLSFPPIKETRKRGDLLNRIMPMIASLEAHNLDSIFALATNGGISAAEIDDLIELFAAHCQVDMGDQRVCQLKLDAVQNELWGDALELQYDWLDKCLKTVYAGMLGKSKAVVAKAAQSAAAKAAKASE